MNHTSDSNLYIGFKKLRDRVKTDRTFSNGIQFTVFAFLNNGISFLLLIILAKYIPPDDYGKLNLFNTFIVLTAIVISLSSGGYISVSYFNRTRDEFRKIVSSVSYLSILIFLTLLAFLWLFSGSVEKFVGLPGKYQIVGLIICFFQVYNTINLEIWRLEEKPTKYGIYSVLLGILNLIVTLVLVINYNQGWIGRVYAQIIIAFLFFLVSAGFLLRRNLLEWSIPERNMIRECIIFGLPLVPHLASSWIRQGLDRYIVNSFHTVSDVGFFSYAMNFANIILIVGTAFNASNSVFLFKNLAKPDSDVLRRIRKYNTLMITFFILLTLLVIAASYIFIYVVTPQYSGSLVYLIPLCISMFFQSIYFLYVNYLFFFKNTKYLMYITFSVSVIHLILSFILTRYSIHYTAYISLLSSFLIYFLVRNAGIRMAHHKLTIESV